MSFVDFQSCFASEPANSAPDFIRISTTLQDFQLSGGPADATLRDAAHVHITGRQTWKCLRGSQGEAVWPPQLEGSLIEALYAYDQERMHFKDSKPHARFIKRNQFIAKYIFTTTGQQRTAKQVGSRLQQLRSTTKDEHIRQLLTLPVQSSPLPSRSSSAVSRGSKSLSPAPATISGDSELGSGHIFEDPLVVNVSVLLINMPASRIPVVDLRATATQSIPLSLSTISAIVGPEYHLITVRADVPLGDVCVFHVFHATTGDLVYTERANLVQRGTGQWENGRLYDAPFASGFWTDPDHAFDPTKYTIHQILYPRSEARGSRPSSFGKGHKMNPPVIRIAYELRFAHSAAEARSYSALDLFPLDVMMFGGATYEDPSPTTLRHQSSASPY